MPRTPLKQIGQSYAESIMEQYHPDACNCDIEEIQNWLNDTNRECMGQPIADIRFHLSSQQRKRISQHAKKHAREIQIKKLNENLTWYPEKYNDIDTENGDFDIYDY